MAFRPPSCGPASHIVVPIKRVTSDLTVHVTVTGLRVWWLRWKIATWLIRAAALVANCNIVFETENEVRVGDGRRGM